MNVYSLLLAKILLSLVVSGVVLTALSRPLVRVLGRICPDTDAAAFWLSYTRMMLLIAPLLLVLVVDLFARFSEPLDSVRFALMAALAGLLLGLQRIGRQVGRFVAFPRRSEGRS